jgi:uncharacterized membrane protein YcaP (DUF421 family)
LSVKDGKILEDSMMKARISEDEFESYLRLSGNDDISDIKLSYLEINGQVYQNKGKRLKKLCYYYYYRMLYIYIFVVWMQF